MKHIWAPWRMEYIQMNKSEGCILCEAPGRNNDAENHILFRGEKNYIIMNSYPYNPGHLLVVPYRHIASLEGMSDEERHEHIDIVSRSVAVLRRVFDAGGYNLGTNIGKVAGAGIEDHVHTHVVPRWQGDTNFMPVVGNIRVIPQALAETYRRLKGEF